jgi:hypothetical protein
MTPQQNEMTNVSVFTGFVRRGMDELGTEQRRRVVRVSF